ncbi:calcium/sodium antiporter [Thioalkalivibrio sp.]|uniref:calcium/sodium antiporter n=1 Tax=Thioalkalivibrio sp. TaxID=2093813 RepID=UPI0035699B49
MWVHLIWFVLGLTVLVLGAESLVRGAARLAGSVGVSPLVIGLTVVAFGTSTPEMAVAVHASLAGTPDIAIGNVIGSNIANILLILGIAAVIIPLVVSEQVIRQEVPVMIAATVLLLVLAMDGLISRIDAGILFTLVVVYTAFLILQSRRSTRAAATAPEMDLPQPSRWDRHWAVQVLLIVVGLAALVLGSRWLVESAVVFARFFGISDLIVGLTIVAVGTSLPEIATSTLAALRGQRDIAVGSVVGSNLFNILAVLGVTGLVSPFGIQVAEAARNLDLWVMLAVALACLPIMFTGREISRWEGTVFLGYYAAYTGYLVLAAQQHSVLPAFSLVMLGFVLPITILTIVVSLIGHHRRAGYGPRP